MINRPRNLLLTFFVIFLSVTCSANSSQANPEPQFDTAEITSFAKKVEKEIAKRGAKVAIVGRVGRPASELPKGFRYTHTGFGVYSIITTQDGNVVPGYTMYNLYQKNDKLNESSLVQDFPIDFFTGVFELKAGVVIPTPEMQQRLLEVIASDTYKKLHNASYSAVANPFNTRYQNCTEHTLDVINAAIYQTDDIAVIKANNKKYFEPQTVNVGPFKMFLGAMMNEDISLSDQGGKVKTATYTTIANYLEKYGLVQEKFVVNP
ncbi:MAG: DUF2145 domain-containing protein [Gammaproteobacteria bacterium]|nr:DUF2145 domain-containing protein [Gammaproteobacteria bacterium]